MPLLLVLVLLCSGAGLAGVDLTWRGSGAYGTAIGTGLFMGATWLAIFIVQFVTAPPRLHARLDAERLALARQSTAVPVVPILALPAPETAPLVLPSPDLPLLDRPLPLPPLLDLSSLGLLLPDQPEPEPPLLDQPLLLSPLLDLSSLDQLTPDQPEPELLLIDQPLFLSPLLDLSSLGLLPPDQPEPDPPLLDQPLLLSPLLDLSSLDLLPPDQPEPELPLLDQPLLLSPLLDLSSLGLLPTGQPEPELPLLDQPLPLPPLLDLSSLDLLPPDQPEPDLLLIDQPLLLPPLLDLSSLDLLPFALPLPAPPSIERPSPDLPPFDLPLPDLQSGYRAPVRLPAPAPPQPVLSTIDLRLHDQIYETTAVDTTGDRLPASRAYRARVANLSDQTVRRCQLFFCSPMNIQVVSGPFDLAPGEHVDLPALRVIDGVEDPHALLYFLDAETWHVAQGQAAWLPEPGHFKVKVLSANAPPTALEVKLLRDTRTPFAWTLVEATRSDKASAAGLKPSSRASSDTVVFT